MNNYLLDIIKNTTEYIEKHLLEDLDLDCISEHVNVSKFHLLRIWKGATSTGLMEYVRRRRIAQSIGDLMIGRNNIGFISSKYSFGCERTYNRIFKEEFQTTPSKWRKNPTALDILDKFNAEFMNCSGEGLIFFRSITILPSFSIAGMEYRIDKEENQKSQIANQYGVDFFYNRRLEVINPVDKDVYIGFTRDFEPSAKYIYYQPSIKVDHNSISGHGMKVKNIKPHKYGVFTYMGLHRPEEINAEKLSTLWRFVEETWMPTVEFRLKESFYFEQINYAKCNKNYCECDLYYPISLL